MTFEQLWGDIRPVGRTASGGYRRQPWTTPERELADWFAEAVAARGLRLEEDGFGNRVAWWDPDRAPEAVAGRPPHPRSGAVLTGSHLDSVVDGGAFDGPLGVVSALAALDRLRAAGVVPTRPLGIATFVEEEGSRFGLACLGSRLATGSLRWAQARELTDADGVRLGDLVPGEPDGGGLLDAVGTYVELHLEQGRALDPLGEPVGLGAGIWPHGRWRFDVTGTADHAGTTRMEDRADPMLTYATTALAAADQARKADARATFGRVEVTPNGTNAIPSRVRAWLDARAGSEHALAGLVERVTAEARARAGRDGTRVEVVAESLSPAVTFEHLVQRPWPVLPTQAGHDAGVLQAAGIPTAMLFVRNPTGVSHSPAEHADLADCLAGVEALVDVLADLVTRPVAEATA